MRLQWDNVLSFSSAVTPVAAPSCPVPCAGSLVLQWPLWTVPCDDHASLEAHVAAAHQPETPTVCVHACVYTSILHVVCKHVCITCVHVCTCTVYSKVLLLPSTHGFNYIFLVGLEEGEGTKPRLWTLDSGLDCGLDCGLDSGLSNGLDI